MARFKSIRFRSVLLAASITLAVASPVSAQGGGQGGGSSGGGRPASSEPTETGERAQPPGSPSGADGSALGWGTVPSSAGDPENRFSAWLDSSMEGSRLASVRERLRTLAGPALRAGVPLDAFVSRVREAVAKGAPPVLVAEAIESDAAAWIWLAGILADGTWPPENAATDLYLAVATAFRNGLDTGAVSGLVSWARVSGSRTGKAVAALATASAISSEFGASGAGDVARIVAASRLKIGRYDDVAALAARAAASGIGADRFDSALAATLGAGGSLADLERALFR